MTLTSVELHTVEFVFMKISLHKMFFILLQLVIISSISIFIIIIFDPTFHSSRIQIL